MDARGWMAAGAVLAVLAATGCAGTGSSSADPDTLNCRDMVIPAQALEERKPATELGDHGKLALEGHEVPNVELAEWFIVEESEDRVALMREYEEPLDAGNGDIREFEVIAISAEFAESVDGSDWMLTRASDCSITVDLGVLNDAVLALDSESPPQPDASEVTLMVTETECNSGRDAAGRIELVSLTETDTTVEVIVGIKPDSGNQSCPSNPATPFVVELENPLGDRIIVNAGVVPAREIASATID